MSEETVKEKQLAEKAMSDSMVEVHVKLYEPFYNFMKEYLAFFGSKQTVEDLCRKMIYDSVSCLHQELREFASADYKHIEEGAWFDKWPHLACVAIPDEKEKILGFTTP